MKKLTRLAAGIAAAVFCLCLLALPAAAESTPTPAPTADPGQTVGSGVYVQAVTVTDVAGGEVATVKRGDKINLVLRVVDHSSARNNVDAGEIVARINSSVFQYTGAGEIGQLVEGSDQDGRYYSYVLLFREVVYMGGGNTLNINLTYTDTSMAMQQFSTTIGQCVDKTQLPGLLVRESSYGSETLVAGTPFTLSLTVYATAGNENLSDVIATVTLPENITLSGGSLSSYLGTIKPNGTKTVTFSVLPAAGFTAGVANISVALAGVGADSGTAVTGSSTISVPIQQPDRFELGNLDIAESMMVGEQGSVTLHFINKGKNPVSNLEASISGANLGFEGSQQQYVGNLAAGTENSVEFDLTPAQAGGLSGTITLSYEVADGSTKTLTKDFSTMVESVPVTPDMPIDSGMTDTTTQKTGLPVIAWVGIAGGVLVVILVVVVIVRKKRKAAAIKQLEEDEGNEDL